MKLFRLVTKHGIDKTQVMEIDEGSPLPHGWYKTKPVPGQPHPELVMTGAGQASSKPRLNDADVASPKDPRKRKPAARRKLTT